MSDCEKRFLRHFPHECLIGSFNLIEVQTPVRPTIIPIKKWMQRIKIQSKPPIQIKPLFQLSIGLRMLDSGQNWLDTVLFQMGFELTIPFAIFRNSVGTEFAAMIHDQLSQRTEPPISFNHLIYHNHAILSVDGYEFSTSQDFSGCIIKNYADL